MDAITRRSLPLWLSISLAAGALPVATSGCSDAEADGSRAATAQTATGAPVSDQPLAAFRTELLELAFHAASALPTDPHAKNRARAQDAVVAACFALEQPRLALTYIGRIDGWRRGAGYADYAFYCAQHGDTTDVQRYLDLARRIADEQALDENAQAWRSDRIRAKIAGTLVLLGQTDRAAEVEAEIEGADSSRIAGAKAMVIDATDFDQHAAELDRRIATSDLDHVRNALQSYARLFDRFYQDQERREIAQAKIASALPKMPAMIGIELLHELSGIAVDHGDRDNARALLKEAARLLDSPAWVAEHRIPLLARQAQAWHRAGDETLAKRELDAALALYDKDRDKIFDFYRAGALRPIAAAYQTMGDAKSALSIYQLAVEEGAANPNSRPRAEDLSETCVSMASSGVEPDQRLRARMREIHAELGEPW